MRVIAGDEGYGIRIFSGDSTNEPSEKGRATCPKSRASFSMIAHLQDRLPQKTWPAGSTQTLSFGTGGAPHLGGSCQVVLSYDNGATWQVIYSYIGGCMIEGWSWSFPIPSEAPSGEAILGWNWFNKQGNREMYQNCAVITISEGGEGLPMGDDYPPPFVANAKVNECSTVEGQDPVFPRPGKNVRWSGGYKDGYRPSVGHGTTGTGCTDGSEDRMPAGANGLVQGRDVQSVSSSRVPPAATSTVAATTSSEMQEPSPTSTQDSASSSTEVRPTNASSSAPAETSSAPASTQIVDSTTADPSDDTSSTEEASSTSSAQTTVSYTKDAISTSHAPTHTSASVNTPTASGSPSPSSPTPGNGNGHIALPRPSGSASVDEAGFTPVPPLPSASPSPSSDAVPSALTSAATAHPSVGATQPTTLVGAESAAPTEATSSGIASSQESAGPSRTETSGGIPSSSSTSAPPDSVSETAETVTEAPRVSTASAGPTSAASTTLPSAEISSTLTHSSSSTASTAPLRPTSSASPGSCAHKRRAAIKRAVKRQSAEGDEVRMVKVKRRPTT